MLNGLEYLERVHKANRAGYAWVVEQDEKESDSDHLSTSRIIDSRNLCYGHAFVVLAGASAMVLGIVPFHYKSCSNKIKLFITLVKLFFNAF